MIGLAGVLAAPAAAAHADETNRNAHNGARVGLVNAGQVDDPMEDVAEHLSLSHTVND
ncbi:hypothetical protein [Streptomyces oceani]|uniref:hypothetical protein n=1 Tax=Streptomyces oceani TaxID=1075402 RepID=UPI003B848786